MNEKETPKEILKQLIDRRKKEIFKVPQDATDEDTLGIIISQYFEWTGQPIIKAFLSALEDSNYHDLVAQITELAKEDLKE